jgi:hypothetical protein
LEFQNGQRFKHDFLLPYKMLIKGRSASDTTNRLRNRVLYADKVIQQTAFENGLKKTIKLEGGEPDTGAASYYFYNRQVDGMVQTTEAERVSYVESVPGSAPSVLSAPNPPTAVSATGGNRVAIVSFTPPANNGGSAITSYTVTASPGGLTASSASSPIAMIGLTNGTAYTFTVTATNSVGTSDPSAASSPVTPAPLGTVSQLTTVGSTTWTAPANVGEVTYLVVGGGGGSGGGHDTGGGGGGGGGMVLTGTMSVAPGTAYSVSVGTGGTAGTAIRPSGADPAIEIPGGTGGNSEFHTITALGGLGGLGSRSGLNGAGGTAAVSTVSAATGGNGGGSAGDGNGAGGGGGGASGNGANGVANTGGSGGAGSSSGITGSAVTYGEGGRGANGSTNNAGVAGTANRGQGATGGGAAGSSDRNGAQGGSGIVIISF